MSRAGGASDDPSPRGVEAPGGASGRCSIEGATLDAGLYRVRYGLWDVPSCGRYVGEITRGPLAGERVLITCGGEQPMPPAAARARLVPGGRGIAALLYIGRLDGCAGVVHAMVERMPAGVPASLWQGRMAVRDVIEIGVRVAQICARAHAAGQVVGWLRPELLYVDGGPGGLALTAMAPRCERFLRKARRPLAAPYPFERLLAPPEAILVDDGPASDVYSLAGTLGVLATGAYPYGPGDSHTDMHSTLQRRERTWSMPAPLARVLAPALAYAPAARPSMAALAVALARLGPMPAARLGVPPPSLPRPSL
ncbi:hypothetical protein [Haliangium sp.]|uniref:hypothetical protein n=1 Tax=Haliangium sp. TaxID=2663208 RepID=UPI003D0B5C9F